VTLFQLTRLPLEPGDAAHFTGVSTLKRMIGVAEDPSVNVYRVEFEPRARTDWHAHSGPQLLLIVEGVCRYQKWGESVGEASVGDIVSIAPHDKHWHGAAPDRRMVHYAFNFNATTSWLEKVSDAEYGV
jgi:quercetin dioxygenase-like cupin family protein